MNAPPPGPALATPATRRALRRWAAAVAALLAVAVAAGALALALGLDERRADRLAADGSRTSAVVTELAGAAAGRERQPRGTLTIRYDTSKGSRTDDVPVGADIADYDRGDRVTVVRDPSEPGRIEVVGASEPERSRAWMATAAVSLGGLALAGLAGGRRRRARRVLATHPWRPIPARMRPPTGGPEVGGRVRTAVELYGLGDEPLVVAAARGLRPFPAAVEPTAWVAGTSSAFAVAPPGGAPVSLARRVRTRSGRSGVRGG